MIRLGAGVEFDRIRGVIRRLGLESGGIGSDCAHIPEGDRWLVLSCDMSLEEVHFRRDWLSFEEIGWRAAAAALSDLAAAGAEVTGLLASVAMPGDASSEDLEQVMAGVGTAVDAVGGSVLGGDLARGRSWVVDITVVGRAESALTRRGARPGDRVWVTGTLGGSRAAVTAWNAGRTPPAEARARFARPEPRIRAGRYLLRQGARAMMDLSDGLAGDARHLAAASEVALEIDLASLPLGPGVEAAAALERRPPAEFAAEGGEDYELLVAMPPGFDGSGFLHETGIPLTAVGTVAAGSGVSLWLDGTRRTLSSYDHFR
ncbi:MAG: thiamine-phosphate kinase [Gemmatimonadales bacterium]